MISVVISSYNHAAYLAECIDSTLGQTHPQVEVIVVDDGSTDGSQEIISSYSDALWPIFKGNGGQASAWNAGVAAAHGSWVIFLDSDDRLTKNAASAVAAMGAHQSVPAKIHWPMRLIGPDSLPLGIDIPGIQLPSGSRVSELTEFGFDRGPNQASSGNAWHTSFLRQVMPIPEPPFRISPDTFLLGLSPLYGDTAAIGTVCSEYRSHLDNNGAKGSAKDRAAEILRRTDLVFGIVAGELTRRGYPADPDTWKSLNPTYLRYALIAAGEDRQWRVRSEAD